MKTLHYRHAFLTVAVLASIAGCGSRGGEPLTESERAAICEPGNTRECVGRGACRGGQQCGDDARWGACECGATMNSAVAGSPGTGASWTGAAGLGSTSTTAHPGAGATAGWTYGTSKGGTGNGGLTGTNKGGTNAGGTSAGGTSSGGTTAISKGGTNAGGTNAGGTTAISKGGTNAGGTNAGGTSSGGTSSGGTSSGGTSAASNGGSTELATGGYGVGGAYGGTTQVAVGGYGVGGAYGGRTNQAPTITSVRFSSNAPHTDETLWVYAAATDPESDRISFSYTWKRNGSVVGNNTNELDGWFSFDRGDELNVTVTPSDGMLSGIPVTSSTITVENSCPYFDPFPSIAPGLLADDAAPLVCQVGATDRDGDTITYAYQWYLNDLLTANTGQTLPAAVTNLGDRWACNAIVTDGYANGEVTAMSDTTSIVNQVSGIYRTNTTWDASKSPYYLNGRVQVASGVTLTIGPGVTVIGNDYPIESWGNISVQGTREKPSFIQEVTFWDYSTPQSPGKWNFAYAEVIGGALGAATANVSLTVSDCVFRDTWNTIYLTTGASAAHRFERNVFKNCCGIMSDSPMVLINNVFASRETTYCVDVTAQDALTATNNTFFPTRQPSVSLGAKSADLRNNFWGGVSDKDVPDRIFDNDDDLNIQGAADYEPTLASAHANTPPEDKTYYAK